MYGIKITQDIGKQDKAQAERDDRSHGESPDAKAHSYEKPHQGYVKDAHEGCYLCHGPMAPCTIAHPLQEAEKGGACHSQQIVPEDEGCEVGVSEGIVSCLQYCRDTLPAEGEQQDGAGQEKRKEVYQGLPGDFLHFVKASKAIGAAHQGKGDCDYGIEEDPIGGLPEYQGVAEGGDTSFRKGGGEPEGDHLGDDHYDRTEHHLDPGFHQGLEQGALRIKGESHAVAIPAHDQI